MRARPTAAGAAALRRLACLGVLALASGCSAGPDFVRPAPPATQAYTAPPLPASTVGGDDAFGVPQHFVAGAQVGGQWWRQLGSPELDALIDQALAANPTLEAAEATLGQAIEKYTAQAGAIRSPTVDAGVGAQRQQAGPGTPGQPGADRIFDLYNASIDIGYDLDLAGGNRRALEALAAQVDYRYYQLVGAQLALAGNIATTAITQARLHDQLQATLAILQAQDEQVAIARRRLQLGQASQDDLRALEAQAEGTRAGVPLLRTQLERCAHALAVLVGQAPGKGALHTFRLADFRLPGALPLVVPSELVRARPDIQAAEALLRAANADYGVAAARLYPRIGLSAQVGAQALSAGSLFEAGSLVWGLAGQLLQPLFDPGLPAEKRAALAAFDAAAANYRQAVLESLREVADVLRALDNDARSLAAQADADAAAQALLQSMQRRYALGNASYLQLLAAQQQAWRSRIELQAARARRLADTAALYQALGGGVLEDADSVAWQARTAAAD